MGLQFFLMDAAKRFGAAGAGGESLFSSAAALDYALFFSSDRANDTLDDAVPTAAAVRETMTRAAATALDVIARLAVAPQPVFEDFVNRHVHGGGILEILRALRERGIVRDDDVAFRLLALGHDIEERRRRTPGESR